jgi:TonB family protein
MRLALPLVSARREENCIMRTTSRILPLTCLLALLGGTAWGQPTEPAPSAALNDWNSRLQTARAHLIAGEYRQALDIARPLQHEMMDRIEAGPGAGKSLAITVLSRALAEAGLGDMEAAEWDLNAAKTLDPEIATMDLTPFGAAGAALETLRKPMAEGSQGDANASSGPYDPKKEGRVRRPELLRRADVPYPDALQATCAEGMVVVESIIDEEGKIRHARMKESPGGPVMSLAALESLRNWRFRPATLEGKPVKVYYTLTVNFKATSKGCLEEGRG